MMMMLSPAQQNHPLKKRQLELLGIKQSTGGKEDRSKRKSRKGFWKKLSDELRQQIVQWICNLS